MRSVNFISTESFTDLKSCCDGFILYLLQINGTDVPLVPWYLGSDHNENFFKDTRTVGSGGTKNNINPKALIDQGNKSNARIDIYMRYGLITESAHTRARTILGYSVPEADQQVLTVKYTADELAVIMNKATADAHLQFELCIQNKTFLEPDLGIKDYVKVRTLSIGSRSNIESLVIVYAQGGSTTLPPSTRLGRYTHHHLGQVRYTTSACNSCDELTLATHTSVSFKYKVGKNIQFADGYILFISFAIGKSQIPVPLWCTHTSNSCVVWVKNLTNRRVYRTVVKTVYRSNVRGRPSRLHIG